MGKRYTEEIENEYNRKYLTSFFTKEMDAWFAAYYKRDLI